MNRILINTTCAIALLLTSSGTALCKSEDAKDEKTTEVCKARLVVLPAVFSRHFKPEFRRHEKLKISGDINVDAMFTTEHEVRWEAPSFTVSLAEAFVNSRKFDVLERVRLSEVLKELDFGESVYADVSEVVPVGVALNADYVLLPEVEVIHLVTEVKEVPYINRVQPRLKAKMIARLRVVDTAETTVVAALTETVEVERRIKSDEPFAATELNALVLELYRSMALQMMQRAVEGIYPVKMLEVSGSKVVLNRGTGAIKKKDELDVYVLGKSYTDPDTGELLGHSEKLVAKLIVVRVSRRFSEAKVVEGKDKLAGDLKSYLCRESIDSIEKKKKLKRTPLSW